MLIFLEYCLGTLSKTFIDKNNIVKLFLSRDLENKLLTY